MSAQAEVYCWPAAPALCLPPPAAAELAPLAPARSQCRSAAPAPGAESAFDKSACMEFRPLGLTCTYGVLRADSSACARLPLSQHPPPARREHAASAPGPAPCT